MTSRPLRLFVSTLILLVSTLPLLAYHGIAMSRAKHYIGVSIGGGEANQMQMEKAAQIQLGGAGNAALLYEMHINQFYWGIGVEGLYQLTREQVPDFTQSFDRVDQDGEHFLYDYVYSQYKVQQEDVRIAMPLYVGYQFGNYFYAKLGATLSSSIRNRSTTTTQMFTQGTYELWGYIMDPIRNAPLAGFYAPTTYSAQTPYIDNLWIAPSLELGSYIPIENNKVRMRIGAYAQNAFRISEQPANSLVDYSHVDINPFTQNQANLQQNIVFNPLLNSNLLTQRATNLEVGIRFTLLMNVHVEKKICQCLKD